MSKLGYSWLNTGNTNISTPTDQSLNVERRSGKRRTKLDDAGFWDALGGDRRQSNRREDDQVQTTNSSKAPNASADLKDIRGATSAKEQNEQRRASLLSMLHASEERYKRATSRRPTVLAKGVEVTVSSGACAGEATVVLDADYISNRVLVQLSNNPAPQWLPFNSVASFSKSEPTTGS